jgi:hypothetical protein
MVDDDPLVAEFAALRSALITRPPGVAEAERTVRRRHYRAVASATALAVVASVGLGLGVAGYVKRPPRMTAAVNPSVTASPTTTTRATPQLTGSSAALPTGTRGHIGTPPPGPTATEAPCHRYGAALLDSAGTSTVTVRVNTQGLYPLCPGERVRVFAASYTVDSKGVQHLAKSDVGYIDLAHNPITLSFQLGPCSAVVYVFSGNQTIKSTITGTNDIYQDGPRVYGGPQWGPYNGQVWLHQQDLCKTT